MALIVSSAELQRVQAAVLSTPRDPRFEQRFVALDLEWTEAGVPSLIQIAARDDEGNISVSVIDVLPSEHRRDAGSFVAGVDLKDFFEGLNGSVTFLTFSPHRDVEKLRDLIGVDYVGGRMVDLQVLALVERAELGEEVRQDHIGWLLGAGERGNALYRNVVRLPGLRDALEMVDTPAAAQAVSDKKFTTSIADAVAKRPLADATLRYCCNDVESLFLLFDAQIDALVTSGLPHFITLSTEVSNARMQGGEHPFAPQGVIPSVSEADGTARCVTCTRHVAKWSKSASAKGNVRCGMCRAAQKWRERKTARREARESYNDYDDVVYGSDDYGDCDYNDYDLFDEGDYY